MIVKTFLAGFGGQGVLSLGYTIVYAGMLEDKHVTYFPSYGAEVRGGTANCTVAVGDEEIASPIASEPEYVVALNTPSLLKYGPTAAAGGIIFINSSLIDEPPKRKDVEVVAIPANELAAQVANERSMNMVMLGAVSAKTGLVTPKAVKAALGKIYEQKTKIRDLNLKAFDRGFKYVDKGEAST